MQSILAENSEVFTKERIGKLKDYKVKFQEDKTVKPVITPPRPTPYHLEERINEEIQQMITDDVIEEHARSEPAPWISATVIAQSAQKPDGGLQVTMDAKNVNEAKFPTI